MYYSPDTALNAENDIWFLNNLMQISEFYALFTDKFYNSYEYALACLNGLIDGMVAEYGASFENDYDYWEKALAWCSPLLRGNLSYAQQAAIFRDWVNYRINWLAWVYKLRDEGIMIYASESNPSSITIDGDFSVDSSVPLTIQKPFILSQPVFLNLNGTLTVSDGAKLTIESGAIMTGDGSIVVDEGADATFDGESLAAGTYMVGELNTLAINKAKESIATADFTVSQAEAPDEAAAKIAVEGKLSALALHGAAADVAGVAFAPAINGSAEDFDGTDGSYAFIVRLSLGDTAQSANGELHIDAKPYDVEADSAAIVNAKETIEAAIFIAAQAAVDSEEAAKTAVEAKIATLNIGGVSAEVIGGAFSGATSGTLDNLEGIDGSYAFSVFLSLGAGTEQTTEVLALSIIATPYSIISDNADISGAKIAIEGATYITDQSYANDMAEARQVTIALIEAMAMELRDVVATVNDADFVRSVEGTADNIAGVDGYYAFTVSLAKGAGAPQTTVELSLAIIATQYDASGDNAGIAFAKALLESAEFATHQSILNTAEAARDFASQEISVLLSTPNGIAFEIVDGLFNEAVAGDIYQAPGISGFYTFTAILGKGAGTRQTTEMLRLLIVATPYDNTRDNLDIAAAKIIVEGQSYTAAQTNAGDIAQARAAAEAAVGALGLNGVSAAVQDGSFTAAVAGTAGNAAGINGNYAFTVSLSKGAGDRQTTGVLALAIIATRYANAGDDSSSSPSTSSPSPSSPSSLSEPAPEPQKSGAVAAGRDTASAPVEVAAEMAGNTAVASVAKAALDAAIQAAAGAGDGKNVAVEIKVGMPAGADSVEIALPTAALSNLFNAFGNMQVSTPLANIGLDAGALAAIASAPGSEITISASKAEASNLPADMQELVGERPVFEFAVTSGGKAIADFGGGTATVALPYAALADENPNKIVIYRINADGEAETVKFCAYDAATGIASFKTGHFSAYAVGYCDISFEDATTEWFAGAVDFVASRKLFDGVGNNLFAPGTATTRAMFAMILSNLEGADLSAYENAPFTDADSGAWYGKAVAWAADKGIIAGYGDGRFGPDDAITREQMSAMLNNYIEYKGIKLSDTADAEKAPFADADDISAWAQEAATAMQGYGIISGVGGNRYAPKDYADRASVATIFMNFIKKYAG
jgi:hypothetical protein